jgi:hypothetical protein
MVPVVALVDEDTAHRLSALAAGRAVAVGDTDAVAVLERVMAENGWTLEMLVAGEVIRQAVAGADGTKEAPK